MSYKALSGSRKLFSFQELHWNRLILIISILVIDLSKNSPLYWIQWTAATHFRRQVAAAINPGEYSYLLSLPFPCSIPQLLNSNATNNQENRDTNQSLIDTDGFGSGNLAASDVVSIAMPDGSMRERINISRSASPSSQIPYRNRRSRSRSVTASDATNTIDSSRSVLEKSVKRCLNDNDLEENCKKRKIKTISQRMCNRCKMPVKNNHTDLACLVDMGPRYNTERKFEEHNTSYMPLAHCGTNAKADVFARWEGRFGRKKFQGVTSSR